MGSKVNSKRCPQATTTNTKLKVKLHKTYLVTYMTDDHRTTWLLYYYYLRLEPFIDALGRAPNPV